MSDTVDPDGYVRNQTFRVLTVLQNVEIITATFMSVCDGALVFTLYGPSVPSIDTLVYAPGQWIKVERGPRPSPKSMET